MPRRLLRSLLSAVLAVVGLGAALFLHPQPLFAATLHRGNLTLYARTRLPPEASPMMDEVLRRVARSPLYDPNHPHNVFLSGTPEMYAALTANAKGGGVTEAWGWGNVFIRPADVRRGRVFDRFGQEKTGDRTLTYYIAHEVTHAMSADAVGRWRFAHLAAFQQEGYADYVGFAHTVDLAAGRAAVIRDDPEMDVGKSGLYRRYELWVAYLLQRKRLTVRELLAKPMDGQEVEREMLADGGL